MNIAKQIERTKIELVRAKPKSRRHVELELRLRDLIVKQLRLENRRQAA